VTTSVCSLTAPSGYVTTATDQNDSDYDNDGVSTSSDCNDADSSVSSYLTVYQDYDGDGLGNPAVSQQVCALTAPTGYVTNANDTDDSGVVIVVPPTYSQIEYLNNNIDDDGDGVVDEWNTLSSNGVHPVYGSYDPSSSSLYSQTVTSIAGASNGAIKVKFIDGSGYRYNVLSRGSTTVSSYSGAYLLVRSGKRYALVNAYTGAVLDSLRTTASKRRVSVHLKTLSLHRK
jgi:stage V sporulation protein SpoVS